MRPRSPHWNGWLADKPWRLSCCKGLERRTPAEKREHLRCHRAGQFGPRRLGGVPESRCERGRHPGIHSEVRYDFGEAGPIV